MLVENLKEFDFFQANPVKRICNYLRILTSRTNTIMHGCYKKKTASVIIIMTMAMMIPAALAQQENKGAGSLSFEVVSIKQQKGQITFSRDPSIHGRRVTATASTLLDLIKTAYGVRYDQISGVPGWASSEHYDIEAKAEDRDVVLTMDECRVMLRAVLAERFQLKAHRETQEIPMYALVVGKSGPKMKPVGVDATGGGFVRSNDQGNHMKTTKGTMAQLADQLSVTAGRPVVDKTGLQGYYAYSLAWFPANRTMPPDLPAPDMFQAVRDQLGLKLESVKGPSEKLVIDYVEKPSEN
jgi:uncharacterized protein (TIGR03435 family)